MNTIKKQKNHAFGKDIYLLGVDKWGQKNWLEAPSWDCNWYWGFGYVETYTNNKNPHLAKDISSHSHFDGLIFVKDDTGKFIYHLNENSQFESTVLTEKESWELSELMQRFYNLRKSAEIFKNGVGVTSSKCDNKRPEIVKIINEEELPKIFNRIIEILTPSEQ